MRRLIDFITNKLWGNSRTDISRDTEILERANALSIPEGRRQLILQRHVRYLSLGTKLKGWINTHTFVSQLEANIFDGTSPLWVKFDTITSWREAQITELMWLASSFPEDIRMNFWHALWDQRDARRFQRLCFLLNYWQRYKGSLWKSPYQSNDKWARALEKVYMNFASTKYPSSIDRVDWKDAKTLENLPSCFALLGIKIISPEEWVGLLEEYFLVKNPAFTELRSHGANMWDIWPLFFRKHAQLLRSDHPMVEEVKAAVWVTQFQELMERINEWEERIWDLVTSVTEQVAMGIRPDNPESPHLSDWSTLDASIPKPIPSPVWNSTSIGIPETYKFPKPKLLTSFRKWLSGSRSWVYRVRREAITHSIPYKSFTNLWIFVPVDSWKITWKWIALGEWEDTNIPCIPNFQYRFVFTRNSDHPVEWTNLGNVTEFSYSPRVHEVQVPEPPNLTATVIDTTRKDVFAATAIPGPDSDKHEREKVEALSLRILIELETRTHSALYDEWIGAYVLIVPDDTDILVYYFPEWERIEVHSWELVFNDEDILVVENDIRQFFQNEIVRIQQENDEKNREAISIAWRYCAWILEKLNLSPAPLASFRFWDDGNVFTGMWLTLWSPNKHVSRIYEAMDANDLEIVAERVGNWWELRIILMLEGEEESVGSIISTSEAPYYRIEHWNEHPQSDSLRQILRDLLVIYWYFWARKWFWGRDRIGNTVYWNALHLSDDDIERILNWKVSTTITSPLWVAGRKLSKYELSLVRSNIYRWILGEWKSRMKNGEIHWKKSQEDLYDVDTKSIILVDEKIHYLWDWETPEVYRIIREDRRLQKYLVLRIIATLNQKRFRNKGPFSGRMHTVFMGFWSGIDPTIQREFLTTMGEDGPWTERAVEILDQDWISLLDKLLTYFENRNIGLRYTKAVEIKPELLIREARLIGYLHEN